LHDLEEIDLATLGLVGTYYDMTGLVNAEITLTPSLDVIKVERVRYAP